VAAAHYEVETVGLPGKAQVAEMTSMTQARCLAMKRLQNLVGGSGTSSRLGEAEAMCKSASGDVYAN